MEVTPPKSDLGACEARPTTPTIDASIKTDASLAPVLISYNLLPKQVSNPVY
jgi:hypothetical protein